MCFFVQRRGIGITLCAVEQHRRAPQRIVGERVFGIRRREFFVHGDGIILFANRGIRGGFAEVRIGDAFVLGTSRRAEGGVVPAWLSCPMITASYQTCACAPVTTPICLPSRTITM